VTHRALAQAGLVVSGAFLISRILGWIRVAIIAITIGAGPELDAFFAACDERVTRAGASGRKGTLQAWRDQAMFKIAFGWGLRRRELAMLDVCDFRPDARLPEFGGYAQVHVRHGKSRRGGGPQRRTVLTVFAWAVEVVEQYVAEIRPCFGAPRHPAMFLTERRTRIALADLASFAALNSHRSSASAAASSVVS